MATAEELWERFESLELAAAPRAEKGEDKLSKLMGKFLLVESSYAGGRDIAVQLRRDFFAGQHWEESADETDEDEFQLVVNYCRRVVLDFTGMLSRSPVPRVPVPPEEGEDTPLGTRARKREKLLMMIWEPFMEAWRRAEHDAAKCSYGVVQGLWDPPEVEQVETKPTSEGGESPKVKRYLDVPFRFRSIKPELFLPVYRTFDSSDDYLYLFVGDPNRLVVDLELRYGVKVGGTDLDETDTESTCDVIQYWDNNCYVTIARTWREAEPNPEDLRGVRGLTRGLRERLRLEGPKMEPFYTILDVDEHDYPKPPFWVIQNITVPGFNPTDQGTVSDIDDLTGLNQHLNLMRSEQAEEIITNIHPPTVYKSDDHQQEPSKLSFTPGAVYPIGLEEELDRMDVGTQPEFINQHIGDIERSIRTLSFLGDAGFGDLPAGTSGVAARIAMTPLERILELKLPPRRYCLNSVCRWALRVFDQKMPSDVKLRGWVQTNIGRYAMEDISKGDIAGDYFAVVDYGNLLPRDDDAHKQNESFLYKTGVQSLWTYLDHVGEADPDAEIARIKKEAQDPWLNPEKWLEVQRAMLEKKRMEMELQQSQQPREGEVPEGVQANPPGGARETAPPVPPNIPFPRGEGSPFGAGAGTPFLPRAPIPAGGPSAPAITPGLGVRQGGEG